ncbi:MAG: hypothetical protein AAGA48_31715 [Myxococcota bacterium]
MNEAELILWAGGGWLAIGLAVGIPFVLFGVTRIDAGAGGSWTFRPLILPGVAALWPIVLLWWIRGRSWAEGVEESS